MTVTMPCGILMRSIWTSSWRCPYVPRTSLKRRQTSGVISPRSYLPNTSTNSSMSCSSAKSRPRAPERFRVVSYGHTLTSSAPQRDGAVRRSQRFPESDTTSPTTRTPGTPSGGAGDPRSASLPVQIHSSRVDAPHTMRCSRIRRPAVRDELPHDVATAAEAHHRRQA